MYEPTCIHVDHERSKAFTGDWDHEMPEIATFRFDAFRFELLLTSSVGNLDVRICLPVWGHHSTRLRQNNKEIGRRLLRAYLDPLVRDEYRSLPPSHFKEEPRLLFS